MMTYANDSTIHTSARTTNEYVLNSELQAAAEWVKKNKLVLNVFKNYLHFMDKLKMD